MTIHTKYCDYELDKEDLQLGGIWKAADFKRDPNLKRSLLAVQLRANGETLSSIGKKIRISVGRVRQIILITLRKIKARKRLLSVIELA
jgi:hypothetical protein